MGELHVHGGTAVIAGILSALRKLNLRMAEPGEFSRRAFANDKMDLTELEGVADLINAETEAQRRLAVRQAQGELHQMYEQWRVEMVKGMAMVEAYIDFSEEENIEDGVYQAVRRQVELLEAQISRHLDDRRRGEIMRNGVLLSIVGPPNAGKSTLLNRLAQRQVAIVSPIAGTTRDIVETTLDIGGYPVVVQDTAGLRVANDAIEQEGIRRAVDSAKHADLRICMFDIQELANPGTTADEHDWHPILAMPNTFVVLNKADRIGAGNLDSAQIGMWKERLGITNNVMTVSCSTMVGWEQLMDTLAGRIGANWESAAAAQMPLTKARHREHLEQCLAHLETFL
ncbi:mitochondrial splicing system protein, partial [Linderina pennispora]